MASEERRVEDNIETETFRYMIVRPEKGRLVDLLRYLVSAEGEVAFSAGFVETTEDLGALGSGDHRWVIVVSIIIRKIIGVLGKPMEWSGVFVEFLLNLFSENGDLRGLVYNLLRGKVVMPRRNSDTFISAIGHLDGRVDLYKAEFLKGRGDSAVGASNEIGSRAIMDLCMIASKLAYENADVVRNIVVHHWKMHFVEFYNGWNDFQKERSTQVFILCDKPKDANLILISFRGTEPFDADDWSTDFDYSWYEIPTLGKVHMGFLEALGLGSREQTSTFREHLQVGGYLQKGITNSSNVTSSNISEDGAHPSDSTEDPLINGESDSKGPEYSSDSGGADGEQIGVLPEMAEMTAYYAVRTKLKRLLSEHKNAKFVVTGHSLGGALAILFPAVLLLHKEEELMKSLLGVYTFGQPRVGDMKLGRFMEEHVSYPTPKYFRVVYCNDLVPRLPYDNKTFLFKHFGSCLYYNSCYVEESVEEEPNRNYFGTRYLIPEYLNAVWELIRSLAMGYIEGPEYKESWVSTFLRIVGLAIPGISAHSPTDYVNSIRLGRERAQMSSI